MLLCGTDLGHSLILESFLNGFYGVFREPFSYKFTKNIIKTHDRECNSKSHQFQWPAWVINIGICIKEYIQMKEPIYWIELTQEYIRQEMHYDPDTGICVWIKPKKNRILNKPI